MRVVDNYGAPRPTTAGMAFGPSATVQRTLRGEPGFPERLERLGRRMPRWLWAAGQLPDVDDRLIALVGARAASARGCERARTLAETLGARGDSVVSGGAFGIDAAAHEGALVVGARTFAVLGCGVDIVYPDRHGPLFARISAQGGLLSEYAPGTPPRAGQFPARNRIIAALSQAVIVVEAAARSGALLTAKIARALDIPVLAVAGSPGTDGLLRAGHARPLVSLEDVDDALAGRPPRTVVAESPAPADPLHELVAALAARPDSAAGLSRRLSLSLSDVMSKLTEAEIEGWVRRTGGGQYEVNRAS